VPWRSAANRRGISHCLESGHPVSNTSRYLMLLKEICKKKSHETVAEHRNSHCTEISCCFDVQVIKPQRHSTDCLVLIVTRSVVKVFECLSCNESTSCVFVFNFCIFVKNPTRNSCYTQTITAQKFLAVWMYNLENCSIVLLMV